jgi:hypothetical protein
MTTNIRSGDNWPEYYRGFRLQTNPDGDVWWQVYQGTDRLFVDPTPEGLVENLLTLKRLGGRVHITEHNQAIIRVEAGDHYEEIYVGEVPIEGKLVPREAPEHAIEINPTGLAVGDLWPSVYDGAKYSFSGDRVWWRNPQTHKHHPVETTLPSDVLSQLQRLKPRGGSFRVTPWNDVITLVEKPPNRKQARKQLHDLPRVIKNIIIMRRERDVEMLPVYVGSVETTPIEIREPRSLTDRLSPEEQSQLGSWAGSLGETSVTDPSEHSVDTDVDDVPDDDPEDW